MIRLLGSILHHYQNGHAEIREDREPLLAETAEEEVGGVQSDSGWWMEHVICCILVPTA